MANQTVPFAESVHGTNPQNLIEKITRQKIYNSNYWKEHCFGLTSESIVDKAVLLKYCGGVYAGNIKPTPFLCLCLKMLQLQPEKEIVLEYIKNEDFKYLRALGAFYFRMTGKATEIYKYLEPLYNDYRKLAYRSINGWELIRMDEFIDILLSNELACDVALPFLPKRLLLEDSGLMEPRKSILEDEIDDSEDGEEEEQKEKETGPDKKKKEKEKESKPPLVSNLENTKKDNPSPRSNEANLGSQEKNQEKVVQMEQFLQHRSSNQPTNPESHSSDPSQNNSASREVRDRHVEKAEGRNQKSPDRSEKEQYRGRDRDFDDRKKNKDNHDDDDDDKDGNEDDRRHNRSHRHHNHTDRDRNDRDRSRERTSTRHRSRSRDRDRDRSERDHSNEKSKRRNRSAEKQRRRSRDRSRESRYRDNEDRSHGRSRDRERRRDRSRERSRERHRHRQRSSSKSSHSPSISPPRSRNDNKSQTSKNGSTDNSSISSKYPSSAPPPPGNRREENDDEDFDKLQELNDQTAINPYKFKYTAKKFDKMFGKKVKTPAIPGASSSSSSTSAGGAGSGGAAAKNNHEEGSVEYWNQLRESLGIKKLNFSGQK